MFEERYGVWLVTEHGPVQMGSEEILKYFSPHHLTQKNYFLVRETMEVV